MTGPLMSPGSARTLAFTSALLVATAGSPALGQATRAGSAAAGAARWTIPDIVEVQRIPEVAIRGASRIAAFVMETPSVSTGRRGYGLYELRPGSAPKKLLEASYIGDLAARPGTGEWTMRADLGKGVQLYKLGPKGLSSLVVNPTPAPLGGMDGLIRDPGERLRPTGVISYQWSPDGRRLWYARVRLKTGAEKAATREQGVVYDDTQMSGAEASDLERAAAYTGLELRLLDPSTGEDRLIAFAPSDSQNFDTFRAAWGSAAWVDGHTIQYRLRQDASGALTYALWRLDVRGGPPQALTGLPIEELYYSVPTHDGVLTVRETGDKHRLVEISTRGEVLHDFGAAPFRRIGGGLGFWRKAGGTEFISAVGYPDREGLAAASPDLGKRLEAIPDNLEPCAFNADLSFGVCIRENLTRPPELISITGPEAEVKVLYRPNARYDAIAPLRTERTEWVNRYGAHNTGYITWPRDYRPGHRYPALVVTHASDAKNKFAYDGFQWEFPVQVFAERGYFVLSVNEPKPQLPPPYAVDAGKSSVERQQFSEGLNSVASMEAAVEDLEKREAIDPKRIGIAGYSRGGEITSLTISQSRLFSAASVGDDSWWSAGGFWSGMAMSRRMYRNLFGGSPFDAEAWPNYKRFSVSARADQVAGPVLQQFTGYAAHSALELDQLLRDKDVPTELVAYPEESHIFFAPKARASAMARNLDWFDYWLRGVKDPDPAKADEYARWDRMAAAWRNKGGEGPR